MQKGITHVQKLMKMCTFPEYLVIQNKVQEDFGSLTSLFEDSWIAGSDEFRRSEVGKCPTEIQLKRLCLFRKGISKSFESIRMKFM